MITFVESKRFGASLLIVFLLLCRIAHSEVRADAKETAIAAEERRIEESLGEGVPEPTDDEVEVLKSTTEAHRRLGLHNNDREIVRGEMRRLAREIETADAQGLMSHLEHGKDLLRKDPLREEAFALTTALLRRLAALNGPEHSETRRHIVILLQQLGDKSALTGLDQIGRQGPHFQESKNLDFPILTEAGVAQGSAFELEARARFIRDAHQGNLETFIDGLLFELVHYHAGRRVPGISNRIYNLDREELIDALVKVGKPAVPKLLTIFAYEFKRMMPYMPCDQLIENLVENDPEEARAWRRCREEVDASQPYRTLPAPVYAFYFMVPEILGKIGDKRALPVLRQALPVYDHHFGDPGIANFIRKAMTEIDRTN